MDRNRSKQISTLGSRVTSVVSVALMLLLLGIVALTAIAARALTDDVRRNIGFIISMDSEASDADINAMIRTLGDAAFVESYIYSSADEVLEQESAYIGDDVRELIDVNPFSAEFDVRLRPAFANPDSIDVIAAEMRSLPAVGKVMTESALIRGVDSTLRRLTAVLLAIAAAMLLISVVLIRNTVSLSVYARRFIIHAMKLVGATRGFIRRPFVVAGALNGLIAGIVASLALLPLRAYASTFDPAIAEALTWWRMAAVGASMLVAGVALCALAAAAATDSYLRSDYDDMFLK